jgi:hypothetical protein
VTTGRRRSADAGGLAAYLAQFQAGLSADVIVTEIIGSQEYALRATNGLGSPANPNFFTPGNLAPGASGASQPAGFLFP